MGEEDDDNVCLLSEISSEWQPNYENENEVISRGFFSNLKSLFHTAFSLHQLLLKLRGISRRKKEESIEKTSLITASDSHSHFLYPKSVFVQEEDGVVSLLCKTSDREKKAGGEDERENRPTVMSPLVLAVEKHSWCSVAREDFRLSQHPSVSASVSVSVRKAKEGGGSDQDPPENFRRLSVNNQFPRFSVHELVMAISAFSATSGNIMGKGSSGKVYEGKLICGKWVAAKYLSTKVPESWQTFRNEIEIMGFIRNRHIVPLLGYAAEGEHLFLVYKNLKRGTLEKCLHGNIKHVPSLTSRYKIALGIARALHYLHFACPRAVTHRNVKASNILLTKSNKPMLLDFGLAMWSPQTFLICNDIMGTFGYLAPEYLQFGKLSQKIDVYAFGVVLLELITGRKAIDMNKPCGEENLVLWAQPLLHRGCIEQLVDPRLPDSSATKRMKRMIWTASLCLRPTDTCRPSISQALHLLERGSMVQM